MKKILLLGLMAVFGGCSLLGGGSGTSMTAEEKAMVAEVSKNCKYDAEVCKYLANSLVAMRRGVTMTMAAAGNESVMAMDEAGNTSMTSGAGTENEYAMISIGSDTYIKNVEENTWMKLTSSSDETSEESETDFISDLEEKLSSEDETLVFEKLGEEACGNLTCLKYRMSSGSDEPGTETIVWFDKKDYLTRKMEIGDASGKTVISYDYSPVSIVTPSPVVEAPAMPKLPEGVSDFSQEDLEKMMEQLPEDFDFGM